MNKYVFGVDIGGTTCKLGLFDKNGSMLEKWEIETEKRNQGKDILGNIAASINKKMFERKMSEEDVLGIGIGLPGTKDKKGYFDCPNLNWKQVDAEKEMHEIMTAIKITVLNDANAAALGEMWKGSGQGYQNMVMVTIGTGVGGGIIIGGNVLEGAHGAAGEIGGIVVNNQESEYFIAGPKGCLEQYVSATGLVNMARKKLALKHEFSILDECEVITAKNVFDASKQGDVVAIGIVEEFCKILGQGLARISYVIDPEIYIIGGGVSRAGQYFLDAVKKSFIELAPDICRETEFALAKLGNDAGMYGAAYMVIDSIGKNKY